MEGCRHSHSGAALLSMRISTKTSLSSNDKAASCLGTSHRCPLTLVIESRYRAYVEFRNRMVNMVDKVRMSGPTLKLLKVFLGHPKVAMSGAEISKITIIGSGTLYPLLQRLSVAGWIVGE